MNPAPMIPIFSFAIALTFRQHALGCLTSFARECKRISLPVLGPENLDARHLVVADLSERRQHLAERQDAETGQQTVPIFQLFPRQIFGVVDVKDPDHFRIECLDHLESRVAGVEVEAIDDETQMLSIYFTHDLGGEIECGNAAVSLAKKFECERDVACGGDITELG